MDQHQGENRPSAERCLAILKERLRRAGKNAEPRCSDGGDSERSIHGEGSMGQREENGLAGSD